MDRKELDSRLECWAEEYGGGRYENIGFPSKNSLQATIDRGGLAGSRSVAVRLDTVADEIESAVKLMDQLGYERPAKVLRCEYFNGRMPIEERLRRLQRQGVKIKRPTYYDYLAIAKAFVMGQISRKNAA